MSKPTGPAYVHHRSRDLGKVTFTDSVSGERRTLYLGRFRSDESLELYHRLVALFVAGGRRLAALPNARKAEVHDDGPTLNELLLAYWQHAEAYYAPKQLTVIRLAARDLRVLFGDQSAASFGPKKLRMVRESMVRRGLARTTINKAVVVLRAIFKWGVAHELLEPTVLDALRAVEPLKRGRTTAREPDPVRAVPDAAIEATLPHLSPTIRAVVEVQLLTGARPGEILAMRPIDIDTNGRVWLYTLSEHKTAHRGHSRRILIGPRAQAVLLPLLADRPVDSFIFSPIEAEAQRRARQHEARKTPIGRGNRPGTNRAADPKWKPGEVYTVAAYRRAIERACSAAFPVPAELAPIEVMGKRGPRLEHEREWRARLGKDWAKVLAWRHEHNWHPHQLRHSAATRLRDEFGIDVAQTILGHALGSSATEIYAEPSLRKAMDVMARVG